jgi:hypothetical protein
MHRPLMRRPLIRRPLLRRLELFALSGAVVLATTWLFIGRDGIAADAPATTASTANTAASQPINEPGFYAGEAGLNPSERAGREIWYKATAGNSRFHMYTFQQRVSVLTDWYRVLNSNEREDRFKAWGIMNDPGCCKPGDPNCPAKSLDETYGFDYCPGDSELLSYVGRAGYRDPACDFKDAPADTTDVHNKIKDQRQSSCDLAFGTSTGALGFRKFPNPRFDKARWVEVNGTLANWDGFRKRLSTDARNSDSMATRLADGSIEPPFLIGISCGSCHIAFNPLKPPKDPTHPEWDSLMGAIGNQYTRISEVLAGGMPPGTLEFQTFAHARPGTSDTSAVPNDQISNPGTINAIINLHSRPTFPGENVTKWRKIEVCGKDDKDTDCWCEPGHDGKCWKHSSETETVHHILKGGEDSIGAKEAVQRVYLNIGSCAEQCWVNHLTDLRELDPKSRNFGQTPFDIGQCRRDCPNFRAIEDRLGNILDFLMSPENHSTDLADARANAGGKKYVQADLITDLEREFGKGSVARGREVFVKECARCHSSLPDTAQNPLANRDFRAIDTQTQTRADWLGNDQATSIVAVGTYGCRALHSNHMKGHVWEEYSSETLRSRAPDPAITDPADGGRGFYRNISLVSLWAHAPFLHNNALGPELCGKPANHENDFYRSPYVDASNQLLPLDKAPACWTFDPSVEGRFKLYKASMVDLLNPDQRVPKITKFSDDVPIAFGPRLWDGQNERQVVGFSITIPAGLAAAGLGDFQHKQFADDLVLRKLRPDEVTSSLVKRLGKDTAEIVVKDLDEVTVAAIKDPSSLIDVVKSKPELLKAYSSCSVQVENKGHRFGADLPDADKKALTAFLATM